MDLSRTQEPETIVAGDTLKWTRCIPDYLPSQGWLLSYVLVSKTAKQTIPSGDAVEQDDKFAVTVPGTDTASWAAGEYSWQAFVTNGSERHCVGQGMMTVVADLSATGSTAADYRTHNQEMYDAIVAVLENRSTSDIQRYAVGGLGGRDITKMTIAELEDWKRTYAWRVAREQGKAPDFQGAAFRRPY